MRVNPLRMEGILRKLRDETHQKVENLLKILGPHESLSEDLSNNRVSIASKILIIF
jgi:hypothetical protein